MDTAFNQCFLAHAEALLEIEHLCKEFDGTPAIRDLSLKLHKQEVLVVIGPSGCGKSPRPA